MLWCVVQYVPVFIEWLELHTCST